MNRALPTSGFEVGAVGKIGFQNGIIGPPRLITCLLDTFLLRIPLKYARKLVH